MQYTEICFNYKKIKFYRKNLDILNTFVQNIYCGYTFVSHRRGGSNEYPQSMFYSKNKKNRYTPANPSFTIRKWGLRGYTLHRHVFLMHFQIISEGFPTFSLCYASVCQYYSESLTKLKCFDVSFVGIDAWRTASTNRLIITLFICNF